MDDDKIVALLHKTQLRASKIETAPVICINGKEALEHLGKNDCSTKTFLVLLDLNMPVLDGWKFLKKLRKSPFTANVFVVIVTSSINKKDLLKAQNYTSVIHFCRKPLSTACVDNIKNLEPLREFFAEEKIGQQNLEE